MRRFPKSQQIPKSPCFPVSHLPDASAMYLKMSYMTMYTKWKRLHSASQRLKICSIHFQTLECCPKTMRWGSHSGQMEDDTWKGRKQWCFRQQSASNMRLRRWITLSFPAQLAPCFMKPHSEWVQETNLSQQALFWEITNQCLLSHLVFFGGLLKVCD